MGRICGWLAVCLALSSCATQYQPKSFTGGFSETQIDENAWTVSFKGNGYTSLERATDFTLLRSAEIALDHGYRFFVIVEKADQSTAGSFTTPTQTTTNAQVTSTGNLAYGHATSTTYGGQTIQVHKPGLSNTIMCFGERPSNVNGLVYDAKIVQTSVRTKYQMQ